MAQLYPTIIPGLRSPFEKVGDIVYFGRMLDKMRLAVAGNLPTGWQPTRGTAMRTNLDSRCCSFLHVDYPTLEEEALHGEKTDDELLAWAFKNGRQPGEDEIEVWNGFMTKLGWRDSVSERVNFRLAEIGLPPGSVQTMFEFIELDEGRLKLDNE